MMKQINKTNKEKADKEKIDKEKTKFKRQKKLATSEVNKAIAYLRVIYPFYAFVLYNFNLEITNKAERLQVSLNNRSGFNLQINPAFFLSLGKKSRVYALMHETLHVVYKHIEPSRYKNKILHHWHNACEYKVNGDLVEYYGVNKLYYRDGGQVSWVHNDYFKGWSDLNIYDYLIKNESLKDNPNDLCDEFDVSSDNGSDKKSNDPNGKSKDSDKDIDIIENLDSYIDEIINDAIKQVKEKVPEDGTSESFGRLPNNIKEIFRLNRAKKFEWKKSLIRFLKRNIKGDLTYNKPNRRNIPQRSVLIPHVSYNTKELKTVVGVDSSYSIRQDHFEEFMQYFQGLLNINDIVVKGHIVVCDADIQRVYDIDKYKEVELVGRGGTDFRPVFDFAKDKDIDILIYFTDGEGTFPDKEPLNHGTLWILTNSNVHIPWGELGIIPNLTNPN